MGREGHVQGVGYRVPCVGCYLQSVMCRMTGEERQVKGVGRRVQGAGCFAVARTADM